MTDYLPLPGTPVNELDTPCIVVDLDIAEANIAKLQAAANEMGVDVRPHFKTTKSPYWARKQLAAGAIGICCAKVGEAEVMVEAGVPDVMITNQVIGASKITRISRWSSRCNTKKTRRSPCSTDCRPNTAPRAWPSRSPNAHPCPTARSTTSWGQCPPYVTSRS